MTIFLINQQDQVEGEMTLSQKKTAADKIEIRGIMQLNKYIEDIVDIRTEYFCLTGVDVIGETIGTQDKSVVYEFIAEKFIISPQKFNEIAKEGEQNG